MAILFSLALLGSPLAAQSTLAGEGEVETPPNIMLLVADDLGIEGVGAYGEWGSPPYIPHTPNLDLLAENGVLFRNCWANPGCSPTRATLLTGRYSFRTGIGQAINYVFSAKELSTSEVGIAEVLPSGYRTAALGKWHLATQSGTGLRHPGYFGFERFRGSMKILPGFISDAYYDWEKVIDGKTVPSTTYATTDTVDDALAFLDQTAGTTRPWFLWVAFHAPHSPYHRPPDDLHTYSLPPTVQDDVALHMFAMAEAMDREIGRLILGMDPAVRANTVFIFISDNGPPASVTVPPYDPAHSKNTVYEGGLNVPLIIAGKGVARGEECEALVNSTDIFATILDVANSVTAGPTPTPPDDSVSLTPYFQDPGQPSLRPWVYGEYFEPNGINPTIHRRAMREARYKLIQSLHPIHGIVDEELYDLLGDPLETLDLLDLASPPAGAVPVLAMLRDELELLDPSDPSHEFEGSVPGSKQSPVLTGGGVPMPGAPIHVQLVGAPPDVLALLIAGPVPEDAPFAGGIISPHPRHTFALHTDAEGRLSLDATWPDLAPRQGALGLQVVFPEPDGDGHAHAASNALRLTLY